MRKNIMLLFVIQLLAFTSIHASYDEERLIRHVEESIKNAGLGISRLPKQALMIEGMSSAKVRHLLNNLASLTGTNYLEVGTWKGSTWVAALYGNAPSLSSATAIDNWSQFGGPKNQFLKNCNIFLSDMRYQVIEQDCFQIDLSLFTKPINLYFYDGEHSPLSQEKAFTYFDQIFDDTFIAVIDDWSVTLVAESTYGAFEKLNYTVLFQATLPASRKWWNGLHVAVIRKAPSE